MRRARTSTIILAIIVAFSMLVAAGCGGSGSGKASKPSSASTEIRKVTIPKPDSELDAEVGPETVTTLRSAGCELGTFPDTEGLHVDQGEDLKSPQFPPVGGSHFEDWAPFGRYTEPIDDGFVVHNLEHGGVVAWVGTKVDDATVKAIDGLLDDGEKWVLAPRTDIEGLYSAAWFTALTCPPKALETLGPKGVASALDDWYDAVNSTGSKAEKDVPAYAGAMKEPSPKRDISEPSPF
ncbi:MAG: hypothetical protein JWM86_2797 [Thermoleophilia bacterium]|nr:hypothetical protein [Thermoleophilia bacterium]